MKKAKNHSVLVKKVKISTLKNFSLKLKTCSSNSLAILERKCVRKSKARNAQ